tara:strand:+ start:97 stop:516 length:420 start_codon:yes stop_codon:yes gene_type:complete
MYLKLMLNFIILNMANYAMAQSLNVFGQPLLLCCNAPKTGFYRDGFCNTGSNDVGTHVICAEMTAEFLSFTKSKGNDLSTPNPFYDFPGLKPGDFWCLCAIRWKEAYDADAAPKVKLESTHEKALDFVTIEQLIEHAAK